MMEPTDIDRSGRHRHGEVGTEVVNDHFVGVLTFAGEYTTAGVEMPLFFTDEVHHAAAEAMYHLLLADDVGEGIASFIERRPAEFTGR